MSYIHWISNKIPSFTSSFVCLSSIVERCGFNFGHEWIDAYSSSSLITALSSILNMNREEIHTCNKW